LEYFNHYALFLEMDSQQIRFSSSSEINTSGGVFAEPLAINKRRACSNGFPTQLLQTYAWTPAVSTNITNSSGFGGSNTMAMTSSFNSVSALADQKPLSRSLESLAVISGPSTSDCLLMSDGMPANGGIEHRDDSRVNYSFRDYDSGIVSFNLLFTGMGR
jgi:hypothetical protein